MSSRLLNQRTRFALSWRNIIYTQVYDFNGLQDHVNEGLDEALTNHGPMVAQVITCSVGEGAVL